MRKKWTLQDISQLKIKLVSALSLMDKLCNGDTVFKLSWACCIFWLFSTPISCYKVDWCWYQCGRPTIQNLHVQWKMRCIVWLLWWSLLLVCLNCVPRVLWYCCSPCFSLINRLFYWASSCYTAGWSSYCIPCRMSFSWIESVFILSCEWSWLRC